MTPIIVLRRLHSVERRIAELTDELRRAEGERAELQSELLDSTGCHDQRPHAVLVSPVYR